jgi:hypothetical protein
MINPRQESEQPRPPEYTNAEGEYDRDEMNMVSGLEAMRTEEQRRLLFAENWDDAALWQLRELWFNP